jgi:HNH endonuclease
VTDIIPLPGLKTTSERDYAIQDLDAAGFREHACDAMWRITDQITLDENGCWLYTGSIRNGYGFINVGGFKHGRKFRVHRLTYQFFIGPIPYGLQLDHLCRVRNCANPWHLEPVTRRHNILRGESIAACNARKTHCLHGHAFNLENTHWYKGMRYCRACRRESRQQP